MLLTTSYISKSRIAAGDIKSVDEIVATSLERNGRLQITGALIFTGEHFAQILEGRTANVDAVMTSILADSRHEDIVIMAREGVTKRRFSGWALAFAGPSRFVTRHLQRLRDAHGGPGRPDDARWLSDLLLEFSRQNGPA